MGLHLVFSRIIFFPYVLTFMTLLLECHWTYTQVFFSFLSILALGHDLKWALKQKEHNKGHHFYSWDQWPFKTHNS
jgi:hypothetical protein